MRDNTVTWCSGKWSPASCGASGQSRRWGILWFELNTGDVTTFKRLLSSKRRQIRILIGSHIFVDCLHISSAHWKKDIPQLLTVCPSFKLSVTLIPRVGVDFWILLRRYRYGNLQTSFPSLGKERKTDLIWKAKVAGINHSKWRVKIKLSLTC